MSLQLQMLIVLHDKREVTEGKQTAPPTTACEEAAVKVNRFSNELLLSWCD